MTLRGERRDVTLVGQPDQCPRCHHKMLPKQFLQAVRSEHPHADIEELCQCTNVQCGGTFIAVFKLELAGHIPEYRFWFCLPQEPLPPEVPDEVSALSPIFLDVYRQAFAADAAGLDQLTGIGLRKALEFLVKDFAIAVHGEEQRDTICKKLLGSCIADYISDQSVRDVAKRAAWLGNDETHYLRKWTSKDVSDLKTLSRLTINGIDNVLVAKKYIADMPEGAK